MNYTIHCLLSGFTFCGMRGKPCDWPPEHHWLSLSDWPVNEQRALVERANGKLCAACDEAAQATRVREQESSEVEGRLRETLAQIDQKVVSRRLTMKKLEL